MIELKVSRINLIEKLNAMRYDEVSEAQLHHILLNIGYIDKEHYMATEDNVNNNEQNDG